MKISKLIAITALATSAFAAVPSTMLFQGSLSQADQPYQGKKKVVVQLCPSADVDVFTGCQSVYNDSTSFSNGYFSVLLGSQANPLPSFNQQWYLDIAVNNVRPNERTALTSAPSALNAKAADTARIADTARAAQTAAVAKALATNVAVGSLNGLKDAVTITATGTNIITKTGNNLAIGSTIQQVNDTTTFTTSRIKLPSDKMSNIGATLTTATSGRSARVSFDPSVPTMNLNVQSGGMGGGNGSNLELKIDTLRLNNANAIFSKTVTIEEALVLPASNHTQFPTCNASTRGQIRMALSPSSMNADVLSWCQYFSNPGGTGYRWVYFDYDKWDIRQ